MNTSQVIITPENMTKDRKISICVFLSGFSCFAQLYYFQPLLPDLAQEFGLSASYSSLAISFSTLGMVVRTVHGNVRGRLDSKEETD